MSIRARINLWLGWTVLMCYVCTYLLVKHPVAGDVGSVFVDGKMAVRSLTFSFVFPSKHIQP